MSSQYIPSDPIDYDYGQYKLGDSDMIITRGLSSNLKALPRFNNPPEIAVVDVEPVA